MIRRRRKILLGREEGVAMVAALGLITSMATYGLALMTTGLADIQAAERFENRLVAFHWAEGAVDQTIVALKSNAGYSGVPSTSATNGRVTGSYQSTVTSTGSANIYQVAATGIVGSNAASYGYQQRNITAFVDLSSQSSSGYPLFSNTSIMMSGNAQTDAYDSSVGPYNSLTATAEGHIGTNTTYAGYVMLSGNARIKGNLTIGPGGNPLTAVQMSGNAAITGTRTAASSPTVLTPVTVPSGITNLGALTISGNSTVTLGPGTYSYSSINISGTGLLNVTGAATIYVTGNVTISGNGIGTSQNRPPNLRINVQGVRTVSMTGNANFYGAVYAPQSAVNISGNGELFGSFTGNSIADSGNGNIHYDKALSTSGGSSSSNKVVKSWQEL